MKMVTLMAVVVVVMGVLVGADGTLTYNYYRTSCPDLENIVKRIMLPIFLTDTTSPPAFLRLMFHDCQVQGCDASILLKPTKGKSEMDSIRNFGIRRLDAIDVVKSSVEALCPGKVSCADIIALAAKESVSYAGGPEIRIPLGRRDSTGSSFYLAESRLPSPAIGVNELAQVFKGMSLEESVAILGAHTLGTGHCINIVKRLYEPKPDQKIVNPAFEILLRLTCPTKVPISNLTFVSNDLTPNTFDNQYHKDILRGRGLFGIDASIAKDYRTAPIVKTFAENESYFFKVFSSAFIKLSSTNVLTGNRGEIRKTCSRVN